MKEKKQFAYFLRLAPRVLDFSDWSEKEEAIVERHFVRLQGLLADGRLILAGRTLTQDPNGIVILEVDSEEEARHLMESDPVVKEGIMTAEFFPYRAALIRGS